MTDFTFRDPPNFNEGDHSISRKGPTPFQVVPNDFLNDATNDVTLASHRRMWIWPKKGQPFVCKLKSRPCSSRAIRFVP